MMTYSHQKKKRKKVLILSSLNIAMISKKQSLGNPVFLLIEINL